MRSLPRTNIVLGLLLALAMAQIGISAPSEAFRSPRADAEGALPDPAGAVATYFAAREWLDAGGTGAAVATPADVRSAAVVLRLRGRIVGLGKDAGDGTPAGIVDRALRMALDDARSRRASQPGAPVDASAIGSLVTLELELAGAREPLIGRTFEEVARSIEPGECGLQLVDGKRTAYEPASHLLARRMASPVSRAVLAMVTELGLPPRELPELQELGGGTAIYASHAIRLSQRTPGGSPVTLARTLPAAPNEPAARAENAALCRAIVARLAAQLATPAAAEGIPADAAAQMARTGLRGDYVIPADRYEPFAAGPVEQALSAWALARAAATGSWPDDLRKDARSASQAVVRALADVDPSERAPAAEPAAVAYATLALSDLGDGVPADLATFARSMHETLGTLAAPAALASVRPHVRAAVLDAAAARDAAGAPTIARERLDAEIDAAWKDTPAAELPFVAPFLFDAERRLHGDAWPQRVAAHRAAIEAARTVLLATQVRPIAPDRPASLLDMPGAYPMAGSAAGRISAQSTRAQVFVAMLAGLPGTRGAARDDEDRATLGWATRFVRQLTAPEAVDAVAPGPERARGGVLASPADLAQPLAAQAVAILALSETERAHGRLDAAPSGNDRNPGSVPAP